MNYKVAINAWDTLTSKFKLFNIKYFKHYDDAYKYYNDLKEKYKNDHVCIILFNRPINYKYDSIYTGDEWDTLHGCGHAATDPVYIEWIENQRQLRKQLNDVIDQIKKTVDLELWRKYASIRNELKIYFRGY